MVITMSQLHRVSSIQVQKYFVFYMLILDQYSVLVDTQVGESKSVPGRKKMVAQHLYAGLK